VQRALVEGTLRGDRATAHIESTEAVSVARRRARLLDGLRSHDGLGGPPLKLDWPRLVSATEKRAPADQQ
jgi:hypothetical protein